MTTGTPDGEKDTGEDIDIDVPGMYSVIASLEHVYICVCCIKTLEMIYRY